MLLSTLILSCALVAAPKDVVGADRPHQTIKAQHKAQDGDIETTCMTFERFAVVVSDVADTKGSDGTEIRDRVGTTKDDALCAPGFSGPRRVLQSGGVLAMGYILAVKGPLVLLRGDDVFGAHDVLTIFRASDGAMLLDTMRFDAQPLMLKRRGEVVSLQYLQALDVGCDLRATGKAHDACVQQVRSANKIGDNVKLDLDVTKACKRVAKEANLQLGVPVVIADGNAPVVRVLGGTVFCDQEP